MKLNDILKFGKKDFEFDVANWFRITNPVANVKNKSLFVKTAVNKLASDLGLSTIAFITDTATPSETRKQLRYFTQIPNELENPVTFWTRVYTEIITAGQSNVLINDNGCYTVRYSSDSKQITRFTNKYEWKPENTANKLILNFVNPRTDVWNDINNVSNLLDMQLQMLESQFKDQNALSGFIKLGSNVIDTATAEKMKQRITQIYELAENGGIGYLNSNEEFQQLTRDIKKISDTAIDTLRDNLLLNFGITKEILNGSYTEQQYRAYITGLEYLRKAVESELNKKLVTPFAFEMNNAHFDVSFDINLITDIKDLTDFVFKAKYSGVMNANELRARYFNLPAYEGGEIYETNLNAVQINGSNENKE